MKTREQKRLEAARRLDELANQIAIGEGWWAGWMTAEQRASACQKRRDEANRLRLMEPTR